MEFCLLAFVSLHQSSPTASTVTWPTLRKQRLQAEKVYSKCLLGINLVNRGQAWLKIAETSGYILSLFYVYRVWSLYQEFFLFVKTTEHLTNDHEKAVFLRKQIGYFKCFCLIQKLLSSEEGHAHEAKKKLIEDVAKIVTNLRMLHWIRYG